MLTKLKIKEISSVDRGAGDGCRVVIMKRLDDDEDESPQRKRFREIFTRKSFGAGFMTNEEERRNATRFQESREPEEEADVVATRPILPVKLQSMVDAIRANREDLSEEQVVHFLLHTGRGRAVAEHLANITKQEEPPAMSRIERLQSIAKSHGVETIAKGMVADNDSYDVSEAEFTAMMTAEAKRKGMSFTKYFEAPENVDIRKAWQLTKNTRVEKDSLIKPVEVKPTESFGDTEEAIRQLNEMARKLYNAGKYRTVEQAFSAVFQDQRNAELAVRAHRRPNAAYPFPR
jgi:hypothetical protein